jgi:hypothetical protein
MRTTVSHSGKPWTTNKSQPDTSGAPYDPSDAPTKNHPYDHTDAPNASAARKGTTMADMYEIEKMVDAIALQVKAICVILGIDPTPLPNEEQPVNNLTIEALTDPDA